jgi:nucleoside-diphosphate-sugar epimerase
MSGPDAAVVWLTGGSGFIGRRLASFLTSRTRIVPITVDPSANHASGGRIFLDLDDPDSVRRLMDKFGAPASFLHLGWGGMTTPNADIHLDKNIEVGRVLLRRLYDGGLQRFILVGSIDEYGDNTGPLREEMPALGRLTRYAEGKRILCKLGFEEAERFGRAFIHVRLTNTYGPGQRAGSLLNKLYALRLGDGPVDLGPCDNFRDYIYVDEAAEGLARLSAVDTSAIVNLGGGRPVLLRDFVLAFWRHLGADSARLNFGTLSRRPDEPTQPKAWVELTRLEALTGWKPALSLDQGLQQTIAELAVGERRENSKR